jgi:hypothetical protein
MPLDVELFGQLASGVQRRQNLTLDSPVRVLEVARNLGLNPEEVGLITIDGVQSEMEDIVHPNCRVCFFPYMSGG